jgi:hypothetical protein
MMWYLAFVHALDNAYRGFFPDGWEWDRLNTLLDIQAGIVRDCHPEGGDGWNEEEPDADALKRLAEWVEDLRAESAGKDAVSDVLRKEMEEVDRLLEEMGVEGTGGPSVSVADSPDDIGAFLDFFANETDTAKDARQLEANAVAVLRVLDRIVQALEDAGDDDLLTLTAGLDGDD